MHPFRLLQALKKSLKQRRQHKQQEQKQQQPQQTANNDAYSLQEQVAYASAALSRSGRSVNQLYRKLSGQALDIAVKPKVLGNLPTLGNPDGVLTFYVLKEYSRSNSVLIDLQTHTHGFPPALAAIEDAAHNLYENAAIIFLNHPHAAGRKVSPRLTRLVTAARQNPTLAINLVPVTILWGRAPDNEDSWFKLLMADNWEDPSIAKQIFNIGVMGRDTFVEFHPPQSLHALIDGLANRVGEVDAHAKKPLVSAAAAFLPPGAQAPEDGSQALLQQAQPHSIKPPINDTNKNTAKPLNQPDTYNKQSAVESTVLMTAAEANISLALLVHYKLNAYLDSQRKSMIGADLSDRRNLVEQLIYSAAITDACEKEAQSAKTTVREARQLAKGYANEIVNNYNYSVIRFFFNFLNWLWTQLYDGVEVHHFDRVRALAATHEIIYVPCHRSHVDYLLLAYVVFKNGLTLPYIAAGNNLDIPVLGPLLRSAVAFYIRRSFKDNNLYKAVLREYLHTLIQRNTPVEFFIEGGRSRTGRLLPPKMGMLAMTVHSYLRGANKPLVFIPTYVGYERIMEGGTYIGELKGKPKESESLLGLLKVTRKIERIFGHVHVSFGTPLHMEDFMHKFDVLPNSLPANRTDTPFDAKTLAMVDNLAIKIMQNINKAAVINPISLLSLVLLSSPKSALDEAICREQIGLYQRIASNMPYAADTTMTTMAPQSIINYGIKLKLIERTPHILGDMVKVLPKQAAILSYFRNNTLHIFILDSFIAALLIRNGRIKRQRLDAIVTQLYPFLQSELFLHYAARHLTEVIAQKVNNLIDQGVIVDLAEGVLGAPDNNSEPYQRLQMLAAPVSHSLERYFLTLALLAQQGSGKLSTEQVIDLCHLLAQRLSVLYADDIPDFFDRALFTSFLNALIRLEYVHKDSKTGILTFDARIDTIAGYSHYVLTPDVMQVLQHVANLTDADINHAIAEINHKKLRKFSRKR